jgi:hypothetical protein
MEGTQKGIEQGQARRREREAQERWEKEQEAQAKRDELSRKQIEAMLFPTLEKNRILGEPDRQASAGMPGMDKMPEVTVSGRPGGKDVTLFTPAARAPQPGRPASGLSAVSEERRLALGLPTRTQVAKSEQERNVLELEQRFQAGEQLTPQELETIKQATPEARQLERITRLEAPLTSLAERYVKNIMTTTKGRISASQLEQMSGEAFNSFKKDRQLAMLNMTPDQEPYAQTFFSQAIMDAFNAQEEMDLKKAIAEAQKIARTGRTPAQISTSINQLTTRMQARINNLDRNGMLSTISKLDSPVVPEMMRTAWEEYQRLNQGLSTLMNAQAQFNNEQISSEDVSELLGRFSALMEGGGSGAAVGGPARAQGAGPGAGGGGKSEALLAWEQYAKDFGEAEAKSDLGPKPPR